MVKNTRKIWIDSFALIIKQPVIIFPFVVLAFIEALALELIYFFPARPLAPLTKPLIQRLFGEVFVHYPGSLVILPQLFYYAQMLIYVFCGVLLMAGCVQIFKAVKTETALDPGKIIKDALKRYPAFVFYGLLVAVLAILIKRADILIFAKLINLAKKVPAQTEAASLQLVLALILFFSNLIMHTFLILTVPLMVIQKKSLLQALCKSISLGFKNFIRIFSLIFAPFLLYLPIIILKNSPLQIAERAFPEINLYITASGIIVAMLLNCLIIVCVSEFLWDKEKSSVKP